MPAWALSFVVYALAGALPGSSVVEDSVDLIEINTVIGSEGQVILRQLIVWDFEQPEGRYHVRDWRLFNGEPVRTAGGWQVLFDDKDVLRKIKAEYVKISLTMHDPEIEERDVRPECKRRKLTNKATR